jgi:hypothetical protein
MRYFADTIVWMAKRSTTGQPSFYVPLGLAQQGEEGYDKTSMLIGAFSGTYTSSTRRRNIPRSFAKSRDRCQLRWWCPWLHSEHLDIGGSISQIYHPDRCCTSDHRWRVLRRISQRRNVPGRTFRRGLGCRCSIHGKHFPLPHLPGLRPHIMNRVEVNPSD